MTPDLHELDAFAAVARHRSFRKAAAERGVSASALSHAMRGLKSGWACAFYTAPRAA